MKRSMLVIPVAVILLAIGLSSIFIVNQTEKVLVLRFGQIKSVRETPGLYFKVPMIEEVVRYDNRMLGRDIDPLEITPLDDRRLVVDAFARYRIVDVVRFREAVGAGGEDFAEKRIDTILRAQTREVLGSVKSEAILSPDRTVLAARIRDAARTEAAALGIEIVDVRLKRTDLPEQNLEATFARMRAEREREATDQIARGNEAAQRVRATADRSVIELVSDAKRQAEVIRGQADAKRNGIFATAFGADQEFFEFYRSLSAYRTALEGSNSTMVLAPDSEFFNYLQSNRSLAAQPATTAPATTTPAP